MPRLKRLSGQQVIDILAGFGFFIHSQRGSHVKLKRISTAGATQTLTVPRHHQMDLGTIQAIFRQACRFIPEDQLRAEFFID